MSRETDLEALLREALEHLDDLGFDGADGQPRAKRTTPELRAMLRAALAPPIANPSGVAAPRCTCGHPEDRHLWTVDGKLELGVCKVCRLHCDGFQAARDCRPAAHPPEGGTLSGPDTLCAVCAGLMRFIGKGLYECRACPIENRLICVPAAPPPAKRRPQAFDVVEVLNSVGVWMLEGVARTFENGAGFGAGFVDNDGRRRLLEDEGRTWRWPEAETPPSTPTEPEEPR
jgi:hypothetical protein